MSKKAIPEFASEDEEREFCSTHDATEFVDFSRATAACFPAQAVHQDDLNQTPSITP